MLVGKSERSWECGKWQYFRHVAYLIDGTINTACMIGDNTLEVDQKVLALKKEIETLNSQ